MSSTEWNDNPEARRIVSSTAEAVANHLAEAQHRHFVSHVAANGWAFVPYREDCGLCTTNPTRAEFEASRHQFVIDSLLGV